jgi:hypothetical protein
MEEETEDTESDGEDDDDEDEEEGEKTDIENSTEYPDSECIFVYAYVSRRIKMNSCWRPNDVRCCFLLRKFSYFTSILDDCLKSVAFRIKCRKTGVVAMQQSSAISESCL